MGLGFHAGQGDVSGGTPSNKFVISATRIALAAGMVNQMPFNDFIGQTLTHIKILDATLPYTSSGYTVRVSIYDSDGNELKYYILRGGTTVNIDEDVSLPDAYSIYWPGEHAVQFSTFELTFS